MVSMRDNVAKSWDLRMHTIGTGEGRIQYAGIWVSNVTRAIQTAQTLICKKTMTHDDEWQLAFSLLPVAEDLWRWLVMWGN